jgi:hypothetical protein
MQYQVRVDDGESSVIVESFDDLGQAVDCYVPSDFGPNASLCRHSTCPVDW